MLWLVVGFTCLLLFIGCQKVSSLPSGVAAISTTVPSSIHVPATVERLIVLYPKTTEHELTSAYNRLDGSSFQLKAKRPSLKIIDRSDLETILNEQRLQVSGTVSDATAIHVGKMIGADSVLLYHIEAPNMRDRTLARVSGNLPSILISSKIILVESGEVVYHNVVTAPAEKLDHDQAFFLVETNLQRSLDRGVTQTIADLQHAFQ